MFLTKFRLLLVKLETTYNTDPTPTVGSNAVECKAVKMNYQSDALERDTYRSTLSARTPIVGKRWAEINFSCELKGSGSLGVAPQIGALLQACGFLETVASGASVMYTPASTGIKSVTIYLYDIADSGNCRLHKITGARGNVSFKWDAGQICAVDFKMQGNYNAPTDVSAPSAPTFESTKPPVVQAGTLSLNGVTSLVMQSISLDMGNEIVTQDDIATANAIKGFILTGRKPGGQFNPEAVLAATYDWKTDWLAATERALSLLIGSTSGNRVTVTAPKLTPQSFSDGDKNGILTDEVPYRLGQNSDAGNDEVVLNFT